MAQGRKKIVIFLYNRLFDPVIQSNIFLYIKDLASSSQQYQFAIITYEDPELPATDSQLKEIKDFFAKHQVEWCPLPWHQGTSLARKGTDVLAGLKILIKLRSKGYRYLVTLASIAGAYGYLYSLVTGFKLYLYQYEPHSEFAVEGKLWTPDSKQYKITKYLEEKSAKAATVISTGTNAMLAHLAALRVKAKVFKITSVVDESLFTYDDQARRSIREKLNIENKQVIVYPGKFGDLYYGKEIIDLFIELKKTISNVFFLILTPTEKDTIEQWIGEALIPEQDYRILKVRYEEMPGYLSASDFGINAIPPTPSQIFRSPIKTGEFLCVGIPYLVCKGVSEDDQVAIENNVGVVVDNFEVGEIQKAIPKIEAYLHENKDALRDRCRQAGIAYRGYSVMKVQFERALQALVS